MTRESDLDAGSSNKIETFGSCLMAMAAPYGVVSIAIGSLPSGVEAMLFPFRGQTPSPMKSRLMMGRFAHRTHFFQTAGMDEKIEHVVRETPAARDAEIARAGEGVAFLIAREKIGGEPQGVIFFGKEICREDSSGRVLALLADYACARIMMILRARPTQPLSDRQIEVLSWAAEGKTDQEIAQILGLSDHTIDKYMRQIKETLGAVNRTAAIVSAMRCGLIPTAMMSDRYEPSLACRLM